jgi:hypothetical protein
MAYDGVVGDDTLSQSKNYPKDKQYHDSSPPSPRDALNPKRWMLYIPW